MIQDEKERISFRSYDFLWLAISLLSLLVIAELLPLTPQDYWWYVRLGQDIARTGSIPAVDTYSFTRVGAPVFYQSWLSALIFWLIYSSGGISLTFFLRMLVLAGTYGLLWFLIRQQGAGVHLTSILVLLAGLAGSSNWAIRTQLLTYPLFVLTILALLKWQRGDSRVVWLIPFTAVLWVNLHGSYPLLAVLIIPALLFGAGERKPLWIAAVISTLVLLINPHGFGTVPYVINMLTSASNRFSLEWLPTVNRGWQANLFFLWLLLFAPLAAFSARRLSRLQWAWFILFGWLGLYGNRYAIWFTFILVVNSADLLSDWSRRFLDQPIKKENVIFNLAVGILLFLLPLTLLPGVRESWWSEAPNPYHGAHPIEATRWLAAHPELEGPLWSDFSHASYLIFMLPSRPVWIDSRFELYPVEQWNKYIAIATAAPEWQNLLDKEGINLVMLSTGGEPGLIRAMRASDAWCELFNDANAVIFSREKTCPAPITSAQPKGSL